MLDRSFKRIYENCSTLIFTLSIAVLTLLCSVAQANPITLTATSRIPDGPDGFSSFTIQFDDTNHNGLFDFAELISFSGFTYNHDGRHIVVILGVPEIPGIAVLSGLDFPDDLNWWYLEAEGSVNNQLDFLTPTTIWTYQLSGASPNAVPEPGSLALLGLGLAAAAASRKRKQA